MEKLRNSLGKKAGLRLGSIGELAKNDLGYEIRFAETIKVFRERRLSTVNKQALLDRLRTGLAAQPIENAK